LTTSFQRKPSRQAERERGNETSSDDGEGHDIASVTATIGLPVRSTSKHGPQQPRAFTFSGN
jgi:predicted Ser/Thr protein kinase